MDEQINRIILIVLDSVGAGALPDAGEYGDEGSDTLGNTARAVGGLHLPHLGKLGLGNLHPVAGVPPVESPAGAYGRMAENISKYCQKGRPLLVEGRLTFDQWETPEGAKRSKHRITVESFTFVDSRGGAAASGSSDPQPPAAPADDSSPPPNDDIPF